MRTREQFKRLSHDATVFATLDIVYLEYLEVIINKHSLDSPELALRVVLPLDDVGAVSPVH